MGRFREAGVRFGRILEEARRRVLPGIIADASFNLAIALYHVGRLAQARAHAMEAVELAERGVLPARYQYTHVRGFLYTIAASQRDWRHELLGLADLLLAEPDPHRRAAPRVWLVRPLARFGGIDVADQVVQELSAAMRDADAAGCERCRWDITLCAIEAYARIGRRSEARELAVRWDARHRDPYPLPLFQRHLAEALLVAGGGNVASAVPLFEAALNEAERMHVAHEAMCVELDLGDALAVIDPERALARLQAAADFAETIGSESARLRAERTLRSLGVRTWKRASKRNRGPLPALSAREEEIVRMISEGASNPEIASALFVSRKTVERHVSNILIKLGVRNRTELASAVGRAIEGSHG